MRWGWALYIVGAFIAWPGVGKKVKIRTGNELDLQGIYSQVLPPVAIYRLIGNDMPPLQMVGQLRWNTQYALDFEVDFPGARRRWILNRIWNDTEFRAIYSGLLAEGVHRRDILLRCFDLDEYAAMPDEADRSLYLTSQNEGRNAGIIDGRESGFEWSMILDGNTFITNDSWTSMSRLLKNASQNGNYRYVKIPYHRLHTPQTPLFLTGTTTMRKSLEQAPIKGESQIAFHKLAPELFTLGDTKPAEYDKAKRRGYGQRNKSYMFKDGQICGRDSDICMCAEVPEGNEEQFFKGLNHTYAFSSADYADRCGLVLRLWNYPPENVIFTGLSAQNETGFFCFYTRHARQDLIQSKFEGVHHYWSECHVFNAAIGQWGTMDASQRQPYLSDSSKCKDDYHLTFLNSSCFRAEDRELAIKFSAASLNQLSAERAKLVQGIATTAPLSAPASAGSAKAQPRQSADPSLGLSTCQRLFQARKMKRSLTRTHSLMILDEATLLEEQRAYRAKSSVLLNGTCWQPQPSPAPAPAPAPESESGVPLSPLGDYASRLVAQAEKILQEAALFSVTRKKRLPPQSLDRHSYYSVSPYLWPVEEVPNNLKQKLEEAFLADGNSPKGLGGIAAMDDRAKRLWKQGYYSYADHRLPGSAIGELHSDNYDRSSVWYMVDNVTTLALAWHLSNNSRYAEWGSRLIRTWFLNNATSMHPKLPYASSLLDWKDSFFLLDSVTLLERSGALPQWASGLLEAWCGRLGDWMTTSAEGREAVSAPNHHGLYFDLTVLSLASFAFEDDMVDGARSRLLHRLKSPYPMGHFRLDGSQPYETDKPERPAGLHYATFNLLGWLHAALAVDSVSSNAVVPGVMPSLWTVRHGTGAGVGGRGSDRGVAKVTQVTGLSPPAWYLMDYLESKQRHHGLEGKGLPGAATKAKDGSWFSKWPLRGQSPTPSPQSKDKDKDSNGSNGSPESDDPPVLLKAIRYLAQFLPEKPEGYNAPFSPAPNKEKSKGENKDKSSWQWLGVRVPFRQEEPFCFDRLLEVVQIGINVYGAKAVFPTSSASSELAIKLSPYSTQRASFSPYSSVGDPAGSGQRPWGALGRPAPEQGPQRVE